MKTNLRDAENHEMRTDEESPMPSSKKDKEKTQHTTVKNYSVAVVATMSAGKSTLLNAMIGWEILPSRNEACTATVFRIEDHDTMKTFRGRYCTLSGEFSPWRDNLSNQDLCDWNLQSPFQIEMQGNLPYLDNTKSQCKIVFIDTPGPNNSMNEDHANIAKRIISEADFSSVIFVINASQSGVNDEWRLLNQMQRHFSEMEEKPQIIFAVNKVDVFDIEKGESISSLIETNRKYLSDLGFYDPIVVPTCSALSLLAREAIANKKKIHQEELPTEYRRKLKNARKQKFWYYRSNISPARQKKLHDLLEQFRSGSAEYYLGFEPCPQIQMAYRRLKRHLRKTAERARKHNKTVRKIFIDNTLYSIDDIKKIELLSGIPLIEGMMQKSLNDFAEDHDGVLGKIVDHDASYFAALAKKANVSPAPTVQQKTPDISSPLREDDPEALKRKVSVEVTYNPFFVKTSLVVNKQAVPSDSPLYLMTQDRLANWIDHFIPAVYNSYRAKRISLHFIGTILDASDVKSAVEAYNREHPEFKFNLRFTTSSKNSDERIRQLRGFFDAGKRGPFNDLFESPEMEDAFERALDPTFEVNVIATMSSGKSTLVNALLGTDLMPSKNEACTATIARIYDDDNMQGFNGQCFDEKGNPLSDRIDVSKEILEKWNDDENTHLMEICGNIPTVSQTDSCSLVVVDTPGPNNSRNEEHQKTTLATIRSKPLSMVIYVLNSTQLSTNDDCWLLSQVHKAMSEGGRQAEDRFIFIANKIDAFDPEKGESVSSALQNVKHYLQHNGIDNPLIIPVSAQLAKLIRLKREGVNLTRKERSDLQSFMDLFLHVPEMNMLNHCRSRLSRECVQQLEARMEKAVAAGDLDGQAELLSGIPIVELLLNEFLQKHAIPAKLKDAVDSFNDVMNKSRIAEKMNEQLQRSDTELKEICQKLESFENDQNRLIEAKEYREKVKQLQYSLSDDAKDFCEELYEKTELLIEQLQTDMSGDRWTQGAAEKQLDESQTRCRQFESELIVGLSDKLKSEYGTIIERLRAGYQARVEKILSESFPEDESLRDLQAVSMTLPSVSEMIEYYSRSERIKTGSVRVKVGTRRVKTGTERVYVGTEQVKVGTERYISGSHQESDSHWYNPFSWGRKKTVYDYSYRDKYESRAKYETRDVYENQDVYEDRDTYENRTFVDMKPVTKELVQKIRQFSVENIAKFEQEAAKNVEKAKSTLLDLMDVIDERVLSIQQELNEAVENKTQREAMIAANQRKIDWFNKFKYNLQEVLSI